MDGSLCDITQTHVPPRYPIYVDHMLVLNDATREEHFESMNPTPTEKRSLA